MKKTTDHFAVACLVAWPLNGNQARVELVQLEVRQKLEK